MGTTTTVVGRRWKILLLLLLCFLLQPAAAVLHRGATAAAAGGACNASDAAGCLLRREGGGGGGWWRRRLVEEEEEWQIMESETSRRMLAGPTGNYIGYPRVYQPQACKSQRGRPYTQGQGCLSQVVNPNPKRPCLGIYRCRDGTRP